MPEVPVAAAAADALDGATVPSVEPKCLTNDANGITATSAGGDAGAGPSSGISGWNRMSPEETTATPATCSGTDRSRRRGVLRACERRSSDGLGRGDAALLGNARGHLLGSRRGTDGALPIERNAADRRRGH